ncbi:MAG TPA: beta-galactosidase [Solirubrobacteraceae bacterium]|nr:beta-galactosidase [Solirubrobacteraceae bacterium]
MFGFDRRPEGSQPRQKSLHPAVVSIGLCLLASALPVSAPAQAAGRPLASASHTTLSATTSTRNATRRSLAAEQRALHACLRAHPHGCAGQRKAVQSTEAQLARATQRLSSVANAARSTLTLAAPHILVSGYTLSWKAVAGVRDYVLVSKVPGRPATYSTTTATTIAPPHVPGATVRYSVRTDVAGSAWATEVSISYPAVISPSEPPGSSGVGSGTHEGSGGETATGTGSEQIAPSGGSSGTGAGAGAGSGSSTGSGEAAGSGSGSSTGSEFSSETSGGSSSGTGGQSSGSGGPSSEGSLGGSFGEPFVKGIDTNVQGWGEALPTIVQEMNTLGVSWAREDLEWSKVEPQRGVFDWSSFDKMVKAVEARGVSVLPIVGYAPSWASPTDATDYTAFVKAAVERYGPGTAANLRWWELWNEPYAPYAWAGHTPEPEPYARDVVAAAQAAKSVAPSVKLLVAADYQDSPQTGGSSPWQTTWIDDMFTAEPTLGKWIDGVSVHPYGDDPALPLLKSNGWLDAKGEWAFQRIDNVRAKFLAHGVSVPFWITEVGWSTWEVTEAAQSRDYSDLIAQVKARPWVRALFPYCLREFEPAPTNNQSGFGLLKFGTWQPKSAFFALQSGLKELS